jgi:hypothetical protein
MSKIVAMRLRNLLGRFVPCRQSKFCIDCHVKISNNPKAIRCRSCSKIELYKDKTQNPAFGRLGKLHPMFGRIGASNPFFGKKHTKETLEAIRIRAQDRHWTEVQKEKACNRMKRFWAEHPEWYKNNSMPKSKNPNWKGGVSFEPYTAEFSEKLRNEIRERDQYLCKNCGMTEEEHIVIWGTVLHVHHIDYNKKNNQKENLLSLCLQCHMRTNSNREHWQSVFKKIFVKTIVMSVVILITTQSFAQEHIKYPSRLWQGLIAEAVGEGHEGEYAVACVVRNRLKKGMNCGLVGLQRADLDRFVARQGGDKEKEAKEVVVEVFEHNGKDTTGGATQFESIDFPRPWWARHKTVQIGKHIFYK